LHPVQSRLLSRIVIRFRVSPPFFPLLSSPSPSTPLVSFKTNSQSIADTSPSFNTHLHPPTHTRTPTSHPSLLPLWKCIRPPSPIPADLVMLAMPPPPLDFPSHSQTDPYQQPQFQPPHHNGHTEPHVTPTALDTEAVQKLAVLAMTTQGCHVSFSVADHGAGWNFLLSGAYQQVLFARGTILKDCPIQVCFFALFEMVQEFPTCILLRTEPRLECFAPSYLISLHQSLP